MEGSFKSVEISKDALDSSKCYLLDCGSELYVWAGRNTSLEARKAAISTVEASSQHPLQSCTAFLSVAQMVF